MTPTAVKRLRRHVRAELQRLRAEIAAVRTLRASARLLDREDAEGRLAMACHDHRIVQALIRRLRAATVEPYSHLSPTAAQREAARRGGA